MIKLKTRAFVIGLLFAGLATGYGSTKLLTTWKNPDQAGKRFHKILVIGMSKNPETRIEFEDALSHKIARDGIEVVPGNSILMRSETGKIDPGYLRAIIREQKMDAVVVSRLVKVDKQVTRFPGNTYVVPVAYRSFYGYYGVAYAQVYTPDYLREDTTVRIETTLYATTPPDGELVWTGTSDTFNPKSARKVIDAVVKLVVKELEKEAIL